MTLSFEEKEIITRHRIERSYQALKEASDNIQLNNWNLAVNRLYYAAFYMAIALILTTGDSAKSHSGVFNVISKNYICTGILSRENGALYRRLFSMRQTGDYDDLFDWTEDDVAPLLDITKSLVESLHSLIKAKVIN